MEHLEICVDIINKDSFFCFLSVLKKKLKHLILNDI